jgi:hypothetical protein
MLRSITILLLSLAASFAADEKPQREEFRLRATVHDVVVLSSFSGTVTPVDADPRFAVTMRLDSITPSLTNFTKGATVTFAVHSPSRLFAAADVKGKTYDFTLRRETARGKTRYSSLEVRR